MMRLSYTDWWNDIFAIARANASILIAVAGALVFLPALLASFALVPLVPPSQDAELAEVLARYSDYFAANWPVQLVMFLLSTLAQLTLYIVLLDTGRPRVGEAFGMALKLFVPFFLTNILVSLILLGGAFLFLIPALYLVGRVLLSTPVLVAERRTNPLAAVGRSFELTRGQGWRIFFFVFLIFLVLFVIQLAVGGTIGTAVKLTAGDAGAFSLGRMLLAAIEALFAAIFFLTSLAIWVALYRKLSGGGGSQVT